MKYKWISTIPCLKPLFTNPHGYWYIKIKRNEKKRRPTSKWYEFTCVVCCQCATVSHNITWATSRLKFCISFCEKWLIIEIYPFVRLWIVVREQCSATNRRRRKGNYDNLFHICMHYETYRIYRKWWYTFFEFNTHVYKRTKKIIGFSEAHAPPTNVKSIF